jgi:predicted dehydrogenase
MRAAGNLFDRIRGRGKGMEQVRVAIIGTGSIAGAHMAAWDACEDRIERVAAVDIDEARVRAFAEKHRIPRVYTDAAEMLREQRPDLVHIATPPAFHAPLAIQCLDAGAHVLCEKPLVGSLRELDAIAGAERRSGRYCSSVVQWRFGSAARRVRQLIADGTLGRHTVTTCMTTWFRDAAYYAVPWRGTWKSELGGVNMGQAIHLIDLMLWLNTPWREVTAITETLDREIEVEDESVAMVRFADRSLGAVVSSVLSPRQETRLRLDFQKATAEVVGLYGYRNANWTITPVEGSGLPRGSWPPAEDVGAGHAAQLEVMLDALAAGERPPAGTDEIRPTIEFLSALYKSGMTHELIAQGSIQPGDPFYDHVSGRVPATV